MAAVTGNLQKIFDFIQKSLIRAQPQSSEVEIRKSLIRQLHQDYSSRLGDSLHNLVEIEGQINERLEWVGYRKTQLNPKNS